MKTQLSSAITLKLLLIPVLFVLFFFCSCGKDPVTGPETNHIDTNSEGIINRVELHNTLESKNLHLSK